MCGALSFGLFNSFGATLGFDGNLLPTWTPARLSSPDNEVQTSFEFEADQAIAVSDRSDKALANHGLQASLVSLTYGHKNLPICYHNAMPPERKTESLSSRFLRSSPALLNSGVSE